MERIPDFRSLKKMSIQANRNVAQLTPESDLPLKIEESDTEEFDYWIRISTLNKAKTIWLPVKLAKYHREKLKDNLPNSSVSLERSHQGKWTLSITFDEVHKKPDVNERL